MKIVEWEDKYRLGIEMIDFQHQYLIKLINKVISAISLKQNISEIRSITQELL
jgi:hemerythrin